MKRENTIDNNGIQKIIRTLGNPILNKYTQAHTERIHTYTNMHVDEHFPFPSYKPNQENNQQLGYHETKNFVQKSKRSIEQRGRYQGSQLLLCDGHINMGRENFVGSYPQTKNDKQLMTAWRKLASPKDELPYWLSNTEWKS